MKKIDKALFEMMEKKALLEPQTIRIKKEVENISDEDLLKIDVIIKLSNAKGLKK